MSIRVKNTPFRIPDILLPNSNIDVYKWAVIACDQFTSSPSYWKTVHDIVGNAPSTLSLIIPEIYLEDDDYQSRLMSVKNCSRRYHTENLLDTYENSLLLVHRKNNDGKERWGITLQIDLSQYDPDPSIDNPIKPTEGIIPSRLPKRIEARRHTCFDTSHVLMLYEDNVHTLINLLKENITKSVCSTDLMMDGGSVKIFLADTDKASSIISEFFTSKIYAHTPMLAVGDGNHSLTAAKQVFLDSGAQMDSPERWALVELVNIFDSGLTIEPIHRVLIESDTTALLSILSKCGHLREAIPADEKFDAKILQKDSQLYWNAMDKDQLPVKTLEHIIQTHTHLYEKIDYIHAEQELNIILQTHNHSMGILFPPFNRKTIFEMVRGKDLFPRKSFSIGKGEDKKYYIETTFRG